MDKEFEQIKDYPSRRRVQPSKTSRYISLHPADNMEVEHRNSIENPLLGSYRLWLSFLLLLASTAILLSAAQLSFTLVCMLETPIPFNSSFQSVDNGTNVLNGTEVVKEFDWDLQTQGRLHSAGFFGLVLTQFFSGWATDRIPGGGKWLLVGSTFAMGLVGVVCPLAARHSVEAFFWLRFVNGMAMGVALPAFLPLVGAWSVPSEQGLLLAIAFSGFSIASFAVNALAAFLCEHAGGWPTIFYCFGTLSLAWSILGSFLVYDKPENHPFVSQREKLYLASQNPSREPGSKIEKTPWKAIFTCVPFWALILTNLLHFGAFLSLGMFLPNYLRDALDFPTEENGILSSIPCLAALGMHFVVGPLFDWVRALGVCSLTTQRKIFNSIGSFVPALAFVCVAFLSSDARYAAIALISVAQAFSEFATVGGYAFAFLDIAPQYTGLLQGISNTFGCIPGFLLPRIISSLAPNGTRAEWSIVILLFAGLVTAAGVVFLVLFSSEQQSWTKPVATAKKSKSENGPDHKGLIH